jgi:hypothetical protein
MLVCLFVCLLFTDTKAFSKTNEKKIVCREGDAAQKKNESRQLQGSKRKTKTEKILKHHACNRIPSLSETNGTRKGAITVVEAKKTKLQRRQLQRSRLSSANNTKSVCAKEKGEKRTGRGERRETTETLFPRIIKQKSKKKTATQASPKYTRDMAKDVY